VGREEEERGFRGGLREERVKKLGRKILKKKKKRRKLVE
jgi:hypothetical protein